MMEYDDNAAPKLPPPGWADLAKDLMGWVAFPASRWSLRFLGAALGRRTGWRFWRIVGKAARDPDGYGRMLARRLRKVSDNASITGNSDLEAATGHLAESVEAMLEAARGDGRQA